MNFLSDGYFDISKTGAVKLFETISYLFRISYGKTTKTELIFLLYKNQVFLSSKTSDINKSLYL